jgi:hypothetical protein
LPIPADDVSHRGIEDGRARMKVTDLLAQDQAAQTNSFTRYPGQVFPGYGVPAYVDYTVDWFHVLDRYRLRNRKLDFAGHFVQTRARVRWNAVANASVMLDGQGQFKSFGTDPVRFEAAPSNKTAFAVLGRERNGRFFRGGRSHW